MKKFTLIVILILISFYVNGQVTVYRTYEDFKNKNGEIYDHYVGYSYFGKNVTIRLKNKNKKVRIRCKDMWGFVYKDALFRIDKRTNQPTRLISLGKIAYYENGVAHLSMLRDKSKEGSVTRGYFSYVSKDLSSKMVPMPKQLLSDARKKIKKFKKNHPEYKSLFECIGKRYSNYFMVRQCIDEFEKK